MVEKRPRQRFESKVLLHKIVEESIKFQASISSTLLKVEESASEVEPPSRPSIPPSPKQKQGNTASCQKQGDTASFQKQGSTASYLDIFGREIMRIVSLQLLFTSSYLDIAGIRVSWNANSGAKSTRFTKISDLATKKQKKTSPIAQSGLPNVCATWTTSSTRSERSRVSSSTNSLSGMSYMQRMRMRLPLRLFLPT